MSCLVVMASNQAFQRIKIKGHPTLIAQGFTVAEG
jgi:hypothetical protein